jgi:hypothetical protein
MSRDHLLHRSSFTDVRWSSWWPDLNQRLSAPLGLPGRRLLVRRGSAAAQLRQWRQSLRDDSHTARLLAQGFDLQPTKLGERPDWLQGTAGWSAFARDSLDGWYWIHLQRGDVAYVCREGRGGSLAGSLRDFLDQVLDLPFWRDLLEFSAGGSLEHMRRVYALMQERECWQLLEAQEDAGLLRTSWQLRHAGSSGVELEQDPVARLWAQVQAGPVLDWRVDGRNCAPLFGHRGAGDYAGLTEPEYLQVAV